MKILESNNEISIEEIRAFVLWWNTTYPIDFWWRNKHSVAFGSSAHRDQNILDMRIEFEEDLLVQERLMMSEKPKYRPGEGNWLNQRKDTRELSIAQASDIFDELDIAKLQEMDLQKIKDGAIKKRGERENIQIKTR